MGRITVFSIEGCPHCRQVKAAFSTRSIPYAEINISDHPKKRSDMISLTDRLTVPQVFFNEDHIGGCDDTIVLLNKWDVELDGGSRARYLDRVESLPGPIDVRLALPTGPPVGNGNLTILHPEETVEVNGKQYTILELTKELIQEIPREDLTSFGLVYPNSFKGSTAVTTLKAIFRLDSRDAAIKLGMKLQQQHFIERSSRGDYSFGDNRFFFRLQPLHTPHVLNSLRVWSYKSKNEPMNVIFHLAKLWTNLESRHLTPNGTVDHSEIRDDEYYWKFENDVCELQKISLKDMNSRTKIAFVLNLYNLMIKYAFVKLGVPSTDINRLTFFDRVSVCLGGMDFSLNDLEHGILRGNSRAPYQLTKQFSAFDSRRTLALSDAVDPRIHFALNCGAKSCPSVKKYTVEALDEEMRLAAMAFCEQDDNVLVDYANRDLGLSKIFYWYMSDFAASKYDLPSKILDYLRGGKKEKLRGLLRHGMVNINFLEYDWSTDDCNHLSFSKMSLHTFAPDIYPITP